MTPFIIPSHTETFRPRQWKMAEHLLFAKADGFWDRATDLMRSLEQSLGVTEFDRLSPEDKKARLLLRLAEASLTETQDPAIPAGYTTNDIRAYDKARRKLDGALKEKNDRARDEAVSTIASIQRQARRRSDTAWLDQTHNEAQSLEGLRGETVELEELVTDVVVTDDAGAPKWRNGQIVRREEKVRRLRISTRDGLLSLGKPTTTKTVDGQEIVIPAKLQPQHIRMGLRYRDAYERADPERGLRSCMGQSNSPGKPDPWSADYITRQQEIALKGAELTKMDLIIHKAAGTKALKAIRHVCGQAKPMRSLAAGSAHQSYTAAMITGLEALAEALKVRREAA